MGQPIDRARAYMLATPGAIENAGGDRQTFALTMSLTHGFCLSEAEVWQLLGEYNVRCQPPWSDSELRHKLQSAQRTAPRKPRGWLLEDSRRCLPPVAKPAAKWPRRDEAAVREICASGFGLADLWEVSPIRLHDQGSATEELIDQLFPGNPLLCCSPEDKGDAATASREFWRGKLARLSLMVPSTMTALSGLNQKGKPSARCLNNTGPRRFIVVEADQGTLDQQAAVVWHLAISAPLTLVVFSGRKSLHSWFFCAGQDEARLLRFFSRAVALGADSAMWIPCQMGRMPEGTRGGGARQTVFFFNPMTLSL